MDDGTFQDDDVFLHLAQLHIGAAFVEGWKLRENIYLYVYIPKPDEGATWIR